MSKRKRRSVESLEEPAKGLRRSAPLPTPGTVPEVHRRIVAAVLAVVAFGLYANTLGHGYVLDDPLATTGNEFVRQGLRGIPALLTHHYRAGTEVANASALSYRPVSLVTFAVEWSLWPGKPSPGHFVNVLLYAFTTALLFLTFSRLLRGFNWLWPASAALLFAVHPLHTEVVANLKSRDEILAVLFFAGALLSWVRWLERPTPRWLGLALSSWFLALLSKESAVTLLPVFPLAGWFFFRREKRDAMRDALLFAVPVAAFLLLRGAVLAGAPGTPSVNELDNPIVAARGAAEHVATSFMVLWEYVRLLALPYPLVSDYSYGHVHVVGWGDARPLAGLALFCALAAATAVGLARRSPLAFCGAAFLGSMALNAQLFVVFGTLLSERLAYAPSIWFCLGAAFLTLKLCGVDPLSPARPAGALPPGAPRRAAFLILAAAGGLGAATVARNPDWRTSLDLFTADVPKAPDSIRLRNGLARELYRQQVKGRRLPAAEKDRLLRVIEEQSRAALGIRPNEASHFDLGNVSFERGAYDDAARHFEAALRLAPANAATRANLAATYLAWGREERVVRNDLARAAALVEKGVSLDGTNADGLNELGTVYGSTGRTDQAIAMFERAAALAPGNRTIWKNLAVAYRSAGNEVKATECEARALGR